MEPGIKVQVKFFGDFGVIAKKSADEAQLPQSATVFCLLEELAGTYGKSFRDELFKETGGLRDDVMVTVNGAIVAHESVSEIDLAPDDVVALFPIFPGGG